MPLDTRIALGVQPFDVAGAVERGFALRDMRAQGQLREQQMMQGQQAMERQQRLRDLVGSIKPDAKDDDRINALRGGGFFDEADKLQTGVLARDKTRNEISNTESQINERNFGTLQRRVQATAGAVSSLLARPNVTHQDIYDTINQQVALGIIKPEEGAEMARGLPGNPEALRPFLMTKAAEVASADARLKAFTPNLVRQDLGGTVQMVDDNPLTRGPSAPTSFKKTMTPGEVATDRRAGERLNFDQQQAGFANAAGGVTTLPGFGKAPPGYMWDSSTQPPTLKAIRGGPADPPPKPSAEVNRQVGGVLSFDKDLAALEEALADFDPRNPADQANTTKRARLQSISKQAQLSAKEAAALGALTGPDMDLIQGILNDPTSMRGAISGGAGIREQIREARAGNRRRVQVLQEQYGPKVVEGVPDDLKSPAPAASGARPPLDAFNRKPTP